jgi:hypothetical protein
MSCAVSGRPGEFCRASYFLSPSSPFGGLGLRLGARRLLGGVALEGVVLLQRLLDELEQVHVRLLEDLDGLQDLRCEHQLLLERERRVHAHLETHGVSCYLLGDGSSSAPAVPGLECTRPWKASFSIAADEFSNA